MLIVHICFFHFYRSIHSTVLSYPVLKARYDRKRNRDPHLQRMVRIIMATSFVPHPYVERFWEYYLTSLESWDLGTVYPE